ncbi:uncharacterized protein PWA37_000864 [Arxiozyma heterogenica]|nr:hypothetical protein RI543_000464 [Kazachstania heterogenica]
MVSSALSLCTALLLAAFSAVSKAQVSYVVSSYTEPFPTYWNPTTTEGEGPIVTVDRIIFNNPYNASNDAKCLLTPEQQAAVLLEHNLYRSMFVDTPNLTWSDALAKRAA